MIGFIRGKVLHFNEANGKLIIAPENTGLAYELNHFQSESEGAELNLWVYDHITENSRSLWSFATIEQRSLFESLKSVNKVGAQKAYNLIRQLGADQIVISILNNDPKTLSKAQGIGLKLAEQMILSLKNKKDLLMTFLKVNKSISIDSKNNNKPESGDLFTEQKNSAQNAYKIVQELEETLASLGLKGAHLKSLSQNVYNNNPELEISDLIKKALEQI